MSKNRAMSKTWIRGSWLKHAVSPEIEICFWSLTIRNVHVIEKCIAAPIDSLKACTDSVGHSDLEVVKSAISGAIRYACYNDGDRIKSWSNFWLFVGPWLDWIDWDWIVSAGFVKEEGFKCLIDLDGDIIEDCLNKRSSLFAQMGKNISIFTEENCR